VADAWPASIVTLAGTVSSAVFALARLTTSGESGGPLRRTVPVKAPVPAVSATELADTETVRVGGASSLRIVPAAWWS